MCHSHGGQLPTRVLDVQSNRANDIVKLLDTNTEHGRYGTLSYCWGTSDDLKTTTKTAERHCEINSLQRRSGTP